MKTGKEKKERNDTRIAQAWRREGVLGFFWITWNLLFAEGMSFCFV